MQSVLLFYMVLTMVYNIQTHKLSGLFSVTYIEAYIEVKYTMFCGQEWSLPSWLRLQKNTCH